MAHIQDRREQGRGWVARYVGPDGKEYTKAFQRQQDAKDYLEDQQVRMRRGEWVDPRLGKVTFGKWIEEWETGLVDLRASSRNRTLGIVRNYLLPRFGDVQLARMTTAAVQGFVAELHAEGLAPATVRKIGHTLSLVMGEAVRLGYISRSPCDGLKLPQEEGRDMVFLSPEEVAELAEAIDPHYRTLTYTAAYTGLRWGELAGLRPERVDTLRRRIEVADQLTEVNGELSFGPPKTKAGRRTVSLPRFLADMLGEQIESGADLVFPTPGREPMRRSNFRRRVWLPAVREVGLDGLRFHDLRHTAVALAIGQGAHPKAIQERMGHSSITTTLDRYGHLFPHLDEQIAEGLDEVFASAGPRVSAPPRVLRRDADGTSTGRGGVEGESEGVENAV